MTQDKTPKPDLREEQINALLDGELEPTQAEQLKREAAADQELARSIIDAYQLQRAMEHVGVERAPASLRKKLKRIPRDHRPAYFQPRWMTAFAVVPLMVLAISMLQPRSPSAAEVEQAQMELAVAFAYIEKVGDRTSNQIETQLVSEMSDAVAGSIFRTVQHQKQL